MSFKEIPYRLKQFLQKKIESKFISKKYPQNVKVFETKKILHLENFKYQIFDDEFSFFGKKVNFFNSKIQWHQDIFSGESYEKKFSKDINIRNNPKLSAKNVWEINRLQFLIHIALNYKLTKEEKYLNKFIEIIESWIESNPYLIGVNWYSNIEINIRLINWFFCWEVLDVENLVRESLIFKEFVQSKWLPCIYKHCKYSYANPSKYSSANNHLISEYSGLYLASSLWSFKESKKWLSYAKEGLEAEIVKQHSKGVNKEEAAEYIQFITDFFLFPYIVSIKRKDFFSKTYKKNLEEIFIYIKNFTDIKLNFPKYGDEDDGYVLNFSEKKHFNNFNSLLVSASIIFNDASYLNKESFFDIKNQLLFSEKEYSSQLTLKNQEVSYLESKFYSDEGHFIFRKRNGNKEIYAHFDAAPLGYLSIAAHGHSDILSFLISINGFPFFIDSGTYSYHTEKKWRSYFVSSKAHNTVTIDDRNQSFHASDTMWLNHFKPKVINSFKEGNREVVKATYSRTLNDQVSNVQHVRLFEFNKNLDEFLIEDEINISDNKSHKLFIPFHLHPTIHINSNKKFEYILSRNDDVKVSLDLDTKLNWNLVRGNIDPILGWYSESFMKKEPTTVIFGEITTKESVKIFTRIKVKEY